MGRTIRKITSPVSLIKDKKKVAAYARVSSGKDAMLHSLSAQISYYSNYIQSRGEWSYVGVYADNALTGTKDDRPEFQRLLADCKQGKIDMIITKSISRFARNTVTLLTTIRQLKELNIDVYFEEQGIHSLSSEGEMVLTLLASVAQEESRAVSENCKWRIRNRFKNGELVNLRFMYGYIIENGKITINPEEAGIVKMIFNDYIAGIGATAIAKKLRLSNIPTCRDGEWSEKRITGILKNEKYAGNALLQKKYVPNHLEKKEVLNNGVLPKYYAENTHQGIITLDVFKQAQSIMAKNRVKYKNGQTPRKKYPFTGMITCENCGKHYRRKTTKYNTYWICGTFNSLGKSACASKQIPENILIELTAKVLNIPNFDESIFKENISKIRIPSSNKIIYVLKNGSEVLAQWQDHSRSESWTDEMKQKAKQRAINQRKDR